ncbi:MAG TPA: hypothetical protein VFA89_21025 [Terriglobales bacterium]|nr:hypothetical protein [Terriglobales bacterium]
MNSDHYDPPFEYQPPRQPYLVRWQSNGRDHFAISWGENDEEWADLWAEDEEEENTLYQVDSFDWENGSFVFSTKLEVQRRFVPNWKVVRKEDEIWAERI